MTLPNLVWTTLRPVGAAMRPAIAMNAQRLISQLTQFPAALRAVVAGIPAADLPWRPEPSRWSVLEIISHLADEEAEDFRRRLRLTLETPEADWPAIDPRGWATSRAYNDNEFARTLDRFISERTDSVQWLTSLREPNWNQTHKHPKLGAISAGQLLASWAAHDSLHLRQLVKRRYELTLRDAGEFTTEYAGEWTA